MLGATGLIISTWSRHWVWSALLRSIYNTGLQTIEVVRIRGWKQNERN